LSKSSSTPGGVTTDPHSGTHPIPRPGEGRALRLLLVEDSDDDTLLVVGELRRGGYEASVRRVVSRQEFLSALEGGPWDVIVSARTLQRYDGMRALSDLQATRKEIPFILLSGATGEVDTAAVIDAGAKDHVLKGDLTRLSVAVERELRETGHRVEQARLREHVVVTERLASAGRLAAGIAHEINNPLAVAIANLEFVTERLSERANGASDAEDRRRLAALADPMRDTREAVERIRDIVRDVRLFSRPEQQTSGPVDVQRAIDSASRMAWNEIRHRALLVKDFCPTPPALADESRLGQVLLNLIVNAAQAMPEGHADRHELRVATRTGSDGRVVIEVADTGAGIAKQDLDRIFDPFFTTKAGAGAGLGLSVSRGIVTQLGGSIEVESELGRGTMFRVQLPAARDDAADLRAASATSGESPRARVLVVDDEVALGRVIVRALEDDHDVEAVTSGREALSRIVSGERFDVILSDLMMPEMTGMELYERLSSVAPDQARRMAFLTGGAFTASARAFFAKVPNPKAEKPLQQKDLLALIARTLADEGP
jgi:signal transduction histidine kinase